MSEDGPNIPPLRPLDYASRNRKYQEYGSPIPSFILGIIGGVLGSIAVIILLVGTFGGGAISLVVLALIILAGVSFLQFRSKRRGAFIAGSICGVFLLVLLAGGVCFAVLSHI
jgi:hypothetical protein